MSSPVLLGVDVGTTGVKVVAVDPDGRLVAENTVRYPTHVTGNAVEQDAHDWLPQITGAMTPGKHRGNGRE